METGCSPVFVFLGDNMAKGGRQKKATRRAANHNRQMDREAMKRQRAFADRVARLVDPVCQSEGMELVHVEFQREPGGLTLRVYLDKPDGVTLDDCVEISHQLEDILDVHAQDIPPYRLEVSSPGLERPVGKLSDFMRFKGLQAKIRMATAVDGRKNFTGVLDGVVDDQVQLLMNGDAVSLDLKDILKARLINYNGER
jgi:ribosome maturation factor RimP